MAYDAKILLDSLARNGHRLTTFEITYPRILTAEVNTHKRFSRNSASSRAIPVQKMLQRVKDDPFIPVYWGKNQKGMQATEEFSHVEHEGLKRQWLLARDSAVFSAESLLATGVHKQITNRLLEPFLWHTAIVTATEWENFFALRNHPDAQPEIKVIASMMEKIYYKHVPTQLKDYEWHLPLINDLPDLTLLGYTEEQVKLVSVGRCARVSYLTHDGVRDPQADMELAQKLQSSGHMSPLNTLLGLC